MQDKQHTGGWISGRDQADNKAGDSKHAQFLSTYQFNQGGLVPQTQTLDPKVFGKDTVAAALTPGEYIVPKPTVDRVGAKALKGLDNDTMSTFRAANEVKRSSDGYNHATHDHQRWRWRWFRWIRSETR